MSFDATKRGTVYQAVVVSLRATLFNAEQTAYLSAEHAAIETANIFTFTATIGAANHCAQCRAFCPAFDAAFPIAHRPTISPSHQTAHNLPVEAAVEAAHRFSVDAAISTTIIAANKTTLQFS